MDAIATRASKNQRYLGGDMARSVFGMLVGVGIAAFAIISGKNADALGFDKLAGLDNPKASLLIVKDPIRPADTHFIAPNGEQFTIKR